ncbi:MAG: hypothetical protein QNK24_01215 [Desulfuromusa sp.]|nr:hypothetical protein [Desulfuromusa sp.]
MAKQKSRHTRPSHCSGVQAYIGQVKIRKTAATLQIGLFATQSYLADMSTENNTFQLAQKGLTQNTLSGITPAEL